MLGSWLKVAQLANRVLEVLTLSLILTMSLKIFLCGHATLQQLPIQKSLMVFSRF